MSNKQIPQRKLGTVLRNFFDHVTSHDEEGVHAALCMVANAAPQDPDTDDTHMHVCSFGAGDPDALAQMMIKAIDTMLEEVPGFDKAWGRALRAKHLQPVVSQVLSVVQQAKDMKAAKSVVDELIEKLKNNPGVMPGLNTKQ